MENNVNQFVPFTKYVVTSFFGQNGNWFMTFDNEADAIKELQTEHYEFGELDLLTVDEFLDKFLYTEDDLTDETPEDANEGDVLAVDNEVLTEDEWQEELGGYLHFPFH